MQIVGRVISVFAFLLATSSDRDSARSPESKIDELAQSEWELAAET